MKNSQKTEEKIKRHILEHNSMVIEGLQKEIDCPHSWKEYGYGYKCNLCDRYTGQNRSLNTLIKRLVK